MLTPRQQQAVESPRHTCVTANAGAGKTRVLVERYAAILFSGKATPAEMVAITYTDKAASELRKRIAERVAGAVAQATEPSLTLRLNRIREELSSAMIGTIHAFCLRLLREHPVEAGVDAAFSVLESLDRHMMQREALHETFWSLLRSGRRAEPSEALRHALAVLGKDTVVQCVTALTSQRERLALLTGPGGLYSLSDAEILGRWESMLKGHITTALADPALRDDLARILSAARGKAAGAVRDEFAAFAEAGDLAVQAAAYRRLMEGLLTARGELRKAVSGGAEALVEDETRRVAGRWDGVLPLLPAVLDTDFPAAHAELLSMTRLLLDVAQQALARYDQKKLESGRLDFDDLLLLARRLLSREQVRAHVASRIRYIMVDEYQDTNRLQYDILIPLLERLSSGNLFIVGDPKQSIYGFRDADVAVFRETGGDIVHAGGPSVVLEESFRPLRDLAAFVNLLFSRVMAGAEDGPFAVPYDPLVRARQNNDPGRVEVLLAGGGDDPALPDEPELIARRIALLHQSRHKVYDKEEKPGDIRFRDIAVLLRSRAVLPELEEALVRRQIPYVVSAGVGYFQTQDVLDFYNYFRFLLDPSNDVALVGILRSPFFVVSDAELFQSAGGKRSSNLWEHLQNARSPFPSIGRALRMLEEDLHAGLRLPVAELIDRIVRRTLYRGKISSTTRGDQARANLEKLQRMARNYEAQGFTSLQDFTARLSQLIDEEEREGQGLIEERADAVQVMTVHAAKGLEFPVVVLPFLDRRFTYDDPPFIDAKSGIGFNPGGGESPPVMAFLRMRSSQKSVAEEKRIFYVACTRARDMLVLSGSPQAGGRDDTCMHWLMEACGIPDAREVKLLSTPVTTGRLALEGDRFASVQEQHNLSLHILHGAELPVREIPSVDAGPGREFPAATITPLAPFAGGDIYSATKIRTYLECPAQYYFRYVLGLPVGPGPFVRSEEDDFRDRDFPAELRGRVFHAVMARIDELGSDPGSITNEAREALGRESPGGFRDPTAVIDHVVRLVRNVTNAVLWQKVMRGTDARTEFTISTSFGNGILTGTMDRIYRDVEGAWNVLDYKTDAIEADAVEAGAGTYWPQLRFYGFLLHRFAQAERVRLIVLFAAQPGKPAEQVMTSYDFDRFGMELLDTTARIERGEFPPKSPACGACPYHPATCPSR